MLIHVVLMAFAVTARASSSEETSISDLEASEAPSRRCGGGLPLNLLKDPPVEDPFPKRVKAPSLSVSYFSYQPLLELDEIYPVAYHFGCSIGVPTNFGCAIQEINGKYLIVGPLLEGNQPRVEPYESDHIIRVGFNPPHCPAGVATYSGCMVHEINGKWLRVAPLPLQ